VDLLNLRQVLLRRGELALDFSLIYVAILRENVTSKKLFRSGNLTGDHCL
jgi:hypothetical protein